jgi:hypothetical protein
MKPYTYVSFSLSSSVQIPSLLRELKTNGQTTYVSLLQKRILPGLCVSASLSSSVQITRSLREHKRR